MSEWKYRVIERYDGYFIVQYARVVPFFAPTSWRSLDELPQRSLEEAKKLVEMNRQAHMQYETKKVHKA